MARATRTMAERTARRQKGSTLALDSRDPNERASTTLDSEERVAQVRPDDVGLVPLK